VASSAAIGEIAWPSTRISASSSSAAALMVRMRALPGTAFPSL
jgi:hypothetical protein